MTVVGVTHGWGLGIPSSHASHGRGEVYVEDLFAPGGDSQHGLLVEGGGGQLDAEWEAVAAEAGRNGDGWEADGRPWPLACGVAGA